MKVFALCFCLLFVFNVVISPTYASETECTVRARCKTPSPGKTKREWMTFATQDDIEQIELLKKSNAEMKEKLDVLEKDLADNAPKVVQGEMNPKGEPTSVDSLAVGNIIKVLCPVYHGNNCFFPVIRRKVDYDGGVAICKDFGGHLANIYSQTHMDDVMKYIRDNRMGGASVQYFRLGMKYDPKAEKLTLRNGTDAPAGLKWYPSYPLTVEASANFADYTNVILLVRNDPSSIDQYLVNYPPWFTAYVLCEIE